MYARWFNGVKYTGIEQIFFGNIDNYGRKAVDFFAKYDHQNPNWDGKMFRALMLYMSTQKLRTPKGLGWLAGQVGSDDRNTVLRHIIQLWQLPARPYARAASLPPRGRRDAAQRRHRPPTSSLIQS